MQTREIELLRDLDHLLREIMEMTEDEVRQISIEPRQIKMTNLKPCNQAKKPRAARKRRYRLKMTYNTCGIQR